MSLPLVRQAEINRRGFLKASSAALGVLGFGSGGVAEDGVDGGDEIGGEQHTAINTFRHSGRAAGAIRNPGVQARPLGSGFSLREPRNDGAILIERRERIVDLRGHHQRLRVRRPALRREHIRQRRRRTHALRDLEARPVPARDLPRNRGVDGALNFVAVERQRRHRIHAPGHARVAQQRPARLHRAFSRGPRVEDQAFEVKRDAYDAAFSTSLTTSPMIPVILKSFGV